MLLHTKNFGDVEIDPRKVIAFPRGILAFEKHKRFIVLDKGEPDLPFSWLQSADDPDLVFVTVNPFLIKKGYEFEISSEDMEELGADGQEEMAVYAIVVVPPDPKKMTVNLQAPLVINPRTMKGKQVVLTDKRYTTRHLLLEEMRKNGRGGV